MTRKHLLTFILCAGLFAMALRPAVDPDVGWHLRTGELIASSHAVPHQDPFSFTHSGTPWIAHEWLSELLMYGLSNLGGTTALVLFFAAVSAAAFALIYARCETRDYAAVVLVLWGAIVTIPALGVRPQMFTLLLASFFLCALDRYVERSQPRYLYALPVLMVFWVNVHAGFAVGIVFILLYAFAEIVGASGDRTRLKHLLLTALACLAVIPLNPNGFRLYAYPLQTVSAPALTGYILEWQSPDFHRGIYRLFLLFIVVNLIVIARSSRRPSARETLLLLFTLAAALTSVRHIPFFVMVAVPIVAGRIPGLIALEKPAAEKKARLHAVLNGAIAICLAVAITFQAWTVLHRQGQSERAEFPIAATAFLKVHPALGPTYNNYDWGGYLIAQHYPVFVDGRSDLYGDDFLTATVRTYQARPGWDAVLQKYGVRSVLIGRDSRLATVLRGSHDWRTAFEDDRSAVFTRVASRPALEPK